MFLGSDFLVGDFLGESGSFAADPGSTSVT